MEHYPFVNTPLQYAYSAFEPYIDSKTMRLHHSRHLQGYIDNLNSLLSNQPTLQEFPLEKLIVISSRLPKSIGTAIAQNAGGVYSHRVYFRSICPTSWGEPAGELAAAIDDAFGSFEAFKKKFSQAAKSVFGSGYAWLVVDRGGALGIVTTANQDTPVPDRMHPIFNVDVWEHAYYLKHHNLRGKYLDDIWKVINWGEANIRFMMRAQSKQA